MTEVLLLLVAILLSLACGAFVAAEFSLTTVERAELERAVERGERGAAGALKAVRNLTFQLSGAQLGITDITAGAGPEAKQAHILRMQQSGERVLMVGDGINDAAVLATADVSVAVADASSLARLQAEVETLDANLSQKFDAAGLTSLQGALGRVTGHLKRREPEQARGAQHEPGHHGERERCADVLGRARRADRRSDRPRHQRNDGDGSDGKQAA